MKSKEPNTKEPIDVFDLDNDLNTSNTQDDSNETDLINRIADENVLEEVGITKESIESIEKKLRKMLQMVFLVHNLQ